MAVITTPTASDDLCEIAGGDGDLAEHPEHEAHGGAEVIAAGLREIASGDDAELEGEPLQQHGHEIGEQNDAQQGVTELRSACEVGRPVARIHVSDGDEVSRSGEGDELAPDGRARDRYGSVDLGEGRRDASVSPAGVGMSGGLRGSRNAWDRSHSRVLGEIRVQ